MSLSFNSCQFSAAANFKRIVGISSIALIAVLNSLPGWAAAQSQRNNLFPASLPSAELRTFHNTLSEGAIAQFPGININLPINLPGDIPIEIPLDFVLNAADFNDPLAVIFAVQEIANIVDEQERQRAAELQRQQLEAAATERERLEAEQRRQYFESLSPEEQQAYLEEQRRQQEQSLAWGLFLLSAMMSDDFSSGGESDEPELCRGGMPVSQGGTGYTYFEC